MTEISFGEVVSALMNEIAVTESELNWNEKENTGAAMKHYQRNVADRLRRLFDGKEGKGIDEGIKRVIESGAVDDVLCRIAAKAGLQ